MRDETIALHSGFDADPATNAVAVPIYQTAAYQFDSRRSWRGACSIWKQEGYRYSRISNPTVAVLEERVAALEGAARRTCHGVGPGGALLCLRQCRAGGPQHRLHAAALRHHPYPAASCAAAARAWKAALPAATAPRRWRPASTTIPARCSAKRWAIPAGNICDIEAIARMAHAHGVPLIVDNTVATPVLLKPARYGADIIVHSLTKFMGGHGNAMGGILLDAGNFDWMAQQDALPAIHHAGSIPITAWSMPNASAAPLLWRAPAASISAPPARSCRP